MDTNQKIITLDRKAKLSTLWIFVLFNVIFRDIHELFRPGLLEQMMAGSVNGVQVTDQALLLAGILIEIPIAMVLLSWIFEYRVNRLANIIMGVFMIVSVVINNTAPDLDNIFFAAIEVVALSLIIWYAWKWPKQES